MASRLEMLLELERRGKLPERGRAMLSEARKRGLVQAPAGGGDVPGQGTSDGGEAYPTPKLNLEQLVQAERGKRAADEGGVKLGMEGLEESTADMIREADAPTQMRANLITALNSPTALAGYGLKQVVGGELSPEEEAEVRVRKGLTGGPGGTTADISGTALATAPAATAIETALAGRAAPGVLSAARQAGASGTAAGAEGGAQPVLGGESRARNVLTSALLGLGLSAGASAGGKVLTNAVRPTADARLLMDRGIVPSVGQGAESETIRGGEALLEGLPWIRSARRKAEDQLLERVVKEAQPPGRALPSEMTPNTMDSESFFSALDERFDQAYTSLLEDQSIPITRLKKNLEGYLAGYGVRMSPKFRKMLEGFGDRASGREFKQLQGELRALTGTLRRSAKPSDKNAADAVEMARDALIARLPAEVQAPLKELDKAFSNRVTLGKAAQGSRGARTEGRITPDKLQTAVKQRTPELLFQRGEGMGGNTLSAASRAMTSESGGDVWRALRQAGYIVGPGKMLGLSPLSAAPKFTLGGHQWQQELADMLRRGRGGAGTAGATLSQE